MTQRKRIKNTKEDRKERESENKTRVQKENEKEIMKN